MSLSLGIFKRNEAVRLPFDIVGATPTGTPTITIKKGASTILSATAMTQGADASQWYHDYTVGGAAAVGSYLVTYTAVVDGVTLRSTDAYKVSLTDIDDVPTVEEIDAELSSVHGATSWLTGLDGTGIYNATINVKDDVPANVPDAKVSVHNSNDDDLPVLASGITDAQGDVTLNLDGNVYIRVRKAGFNFSSTAKNITASGTYNVTGTAISVTPPIDPTVSRCFISVYKLDGTVVTSGIELVINKHDKMTKDVDGNFATNTGITMTYDAGSETWQADIIKGTHVKITSTKVFGSDDNGALIDREFNVGLGATTDLGSIRIS